MDHRTRAGWLALTTALGLSLEASVARWFPAHTAAGSEGVIIASLLGFAAAAFGISAWAGRGKSS